MNDKIRKGFCKFLYDEMSCDFGYSEFTENMMDGILERMENNFYYTDEMVFDLWQEIRSTNSIIREDCIDKLFFDRFTKFLEETWESLA